jgi:hypothetical protein
VEHEAEQVRLIFRRYLELSGVKALVRDLKERNIRTNWIPAEIIRLSNNWLGVFDW